MPRLKSIILILLLLPTFVFSQTTNESEYDYLVKKYRITSTDIKKQNKEQKLYKQLESVSEAIELIKNFKGESLTIRVSVDNKSFEELAKAIKTYQQETKISLYLKDSTSLTIIGDSAFSNCKSLVSIELPDSLQSIGNDAFSGCKSLRIIKIPNAVISIGYYAFSGCGSLIGIELPDSLQSIGNGAFSGCESLKSIEIPNTVTSIEEDTFNACTSLVSIELSNTLTNIGRAAFIFCLSLKRIKVPNSVISIGQFAFMNCESLTNINLPDSLQSIGRDVFGNCRSLSVIYYSGSKKEWKNITKIRKENGEIISGDKNLQNGEILASNGLLRKINIYFNSKAKS